MPPVSHRLGKDPVRPGQRVKPPLGVEVEPEVLTTLLERSAAKKHTLSAEVRYALRRHTGVLTCDDRPGEAVDREAPTQEAQGAVYVS